MKKSYLISIEYIDLNTISIGDRIVFEMPPFCSGDYSAVVQEDDRGLFIDKDDDFFDGCRDFTIKKNQ